ncbi:MAG: hypothetical protein ACXVHJ_37115, partial [Solirubrobacteraceae bacterium]
SQQFSSGSLASLARPARVDLTGSSISIEALGGWQNLQLSRGSVGGPVAGNVGTAILGETGRCAIDFGDMCGSAGGTFLSLRRGVTFRLLPSPIHIGVTGLVRWLSVPKMPKQSRSRWFLGAPGKAAVVSLVVAPRSGSLLPP